MFIGAEIPPVRQKPGGFRRVFVCFFLKRLLSRLLIAPAGGAVVAQLKGRALGLLAVAHAVLAVAHLDLIEGAALVLIVGAAVHGALDAGIGLVKHGRFLLVS